MCTNSFRSHCLDSKRGLCTTQQGQLLFLLQLPSIRSDRRATDFAAAQKTHSNPREIHTHTAIHTHTWSNISSHIQRFVSSFLPLLQFRETQTGFHPRRAAADFSFHFITTAKLLEKRENTELPLVCSPFPTDCSFGKCPV